METPALVFQAPRRILDTAGLFKSFGAKTFPTKHRSEVIDLKHEFIDSKSKMVKTHNQEVYVVFIKKISSFSLFDGQVGSNFNPYQNSTTFCLLENDQQYITKLRNWCQTFQIDAGISDYLMSLKDITERVYFDLVCMVLGVCEGSSNEWVLFLWDGTDAPPLSLNAK
ncbi:hypothetical protein HYC85_009524 [Camellia sinensis]|uniref:Protection of telomeres protein 1 ssDNA-binding domain-containing protein n=1 Tax=Camellia sinensis TaxID=4442 RepID=A0A7J7HF85_CAMSI|nr:hypothetical protein HYC85_009524 [Camellia sinensis]